MREWLSRLSGWHTVVVVGLGLAAVVGVVLALPSDSRSEVVLGLLTLAGGAVATAGALPSLARPTRRGGER